MSGYKCPVCGSQGIPAYDKQDVICPRCNSDLRVYRVLSEIASNGDASIKEKGRQKKLLVLFSSLSVAMVAVAILLLTLPAEQSSKSVTADNTNELVSLRDSVNILTEQIHRLESMAVSSVENQDQIAYYIVHNDSPWSIVKKVFGTRSDWKELAKQIAIDNQLWDYEKEEWLPIRPGQIVKINVNR